MEITKLKGEQFHTIKPLWEELNRLHKEKSDYFKAHFTPFTFEKRFEQFKDRDDFAIFAAGDNKTIIGYCIASVKDGAGEIDSIYIRPSHRKTGIGDRLMEKAEQWLTRQNINKVHISVAQGNEEAFGFYSRHGYHHRFSVLEKEVKHSE